MTVVSHLEILKLLIDYLKNEGMTEIRADLDGFEIPENITWENSEYIVTPELTVKDNNKKHVFEICDDLNLVTDNSLRRWQLLSQHADSFKGDLFIIVKEKDANALQQLLKGYAIEAIIVLHTNLGIITPMITNLLLIILLINPPKNLDAVQFTMESDVVQSSSGYLKLEWTGSAQLKTEVQQSETLDFYDAKLIYAGRDKARVISGLTVGTYYYRVRVAEGSWSDILTVKVEHQSLGLALGFFAIGALVFGLTV